MQKENSTNIPFIRNLQLASEAHEEKDLDPLFELLDPKDDSREMGKSFINVIGYNPITYYTEKAASDVFSDTEEMLADYPKTVEKLKEIEEQVIEDLVNHTEATRAQYAYFGIKGKIRNMIRETGEVPSSKIDEVMDMLERKYNINYKDKKYPNASDDAKSNTHNENFEKKQSDQGTSFQNTREHPVKVRDLPDLNEVNEIQEMATANHSATFEDEKDEDELIFPRDDDDDDSDYSYDAFDDDESLLKDNDYFI